MADEKLLVMRHGEKSDDPDDANLTPAGQARAKALPPTGPGTSIRRIPIAPWNISGCGNSKTSVADATA